MSTVSVGHHETEALPVLALLSASRRIDLKAREADKVRAEPQNSGRENVVVARNEEQQRNANMTKTRSSGMAEFASSHVQGIRVLRLLGCHFCDIEISNGNW